MLSTMLSKNFSNLIFKSIGHGTINHLKPVKYKESTGDIRNIYDEIILDYVLGPPFVLHVSIPDLMAGAWSLVRETMIVNVNVDRLTKEKVAGGVSLSNQCPFCVEAHINMSGGRTEKNKNDIFEWSKSLYSPNSELIKNPPFSKEEAPEIIGTALAFSYINRMVSVFVTDYPLPMPRLLGFLKPGLSSLFKLTAAKNITGINVETGVSLKRMPGAVLPNEFLWAKTNSNISQCFSGFDALSTTTGEKYISPDIQEPVLDYISDWKGEDQGIGNQWIEKVITNMSDDNKKIASLILLVAFQPYKVTKQQIVDLQNQGLKDDQLLAFVSWGSWQATKRISSWLC